MVSGEQRWAGEGDVVRVGPRGVHGVDPRRTYPSVTCHAFSVLDVPCDDLHRRYGVAPEMLPSELTENAPKVFLPMSVRCSDTTDLGEHGTASSWTEPGYAASRPQLSPWGLFSFRKCVSHSKRGNTTPYSFSTRLSCRRTNTSPLMPSMLL